MLGPCSLWRHGRDSISPNLPRTAQARWRHAAADRTMWDHVWGAPSLGSCTPNVLPPFSERIGHFLAVPRRLRALHPTISRHEVPIVRARASGREGTASTRPPAPRSPAYSGRPSCPGESVPLCVVRRAVHFWSRACPASHMHRGLPSLTYTLRGVGGDCFGGPPVGSA